MKLCKAEPTTPCLPLQPSTAAFHSHPPLPPLLYSSPQALIDQPFMRAVLNELAVADPAGFTPPKPAERWATLPGDTAEVYPPGVLCALREPSVCEAVDTQRRKTAFLAQSVRHPAPSHPSLTLPPACTRTMHPRHAPPPHPHSMQPGPYAHLKSR